MRDTSNPADDLLRDALDAALTDDLAARPSGSDSSQMNDVFASAADDAIGEMLAEEKAVPRSSSGVQQSLRPKAMDLADDDTLDALFRGDGRTSKAGASVPDVVAAELDLDARPISADLSFVPDPVAVEPRPPAWARPLIWLDKPFAHLGPDAREFAGKVALVTGANAAGVLLYLLLLRG